MEKVIEVTIANKLFIFEEPASNTLARYLDKIESSIKDDQEVKEAILNEIEKKVAKRLGSIQTNKNRIITIADVTRILSQLGPAKSVAEIHNLTHKIIAHHHETEQIKKQTTSPSKSFMAAHQFIGLLLLTISSLALVFITLGIFNIHYRPNRALVDLPFQVFGGNYQIPSLVMLYLLLAIPLIFLIILGASITLRKNIFSPTLTWFVLTIWILLIIIGTLSAERIIANANQTNSATYQSSANHTLFIK